MQIPFGILILIIALRYRSLVPLVLLLTILMQALGAYLGWFGKGSHSGHHPPEHYGSAAFVVLGTLFFMLSLRDRRAQQEPTT
jgi:peptidoglycan/LPS O-acetylase OafA/YrhL